MNAQKLTNLTVLLSLVSRIEQAASSTYAYAGLLLTDVRATPLSTECLRLLARSLEALSDEAEAAGRTDASSMYHSCASALRADVDTILRTIELFEDRTLNTYPACTAAWDAKKAAEEAEEAMLIQEMGEQAFLEYKYGTAEDQAAEQAAELAVERWFEDGRGHIYDPRGDYGAFA
jgi:uncharacterized protein YutE (UPF0331/DUF86 family)